MFNVTRVAAAMTKVERRAVRLVGQGKINPEAGSTAFQSLKNTATEKAPFSKNIFKRACDWVKSFVKNYKEIKKDCKEVIDVVKSTLGDAIKKSDIKAAKKRALGLTKEIVKTFKAEMKELVKAGKAAGAKVKEEAAEVITEGAETVADAVK